MLLNKKQAFKRILLVSLGAVPGAFVRIFFSQELFANIFGSCVLGFIAGFGFRERYKLIIAIGFCGSCTTFSTWMLNTMELIFDGNFSGAVNSLLSNLFLGLLALSFAFYIGRKTKSSILH